MDPAAGPSDVPDFGAPTDGSALESWALGAVPSVEESYRKYSGALVRFAATQIGHSAAEDLVADVIGALLHRPSATVADMQSYLYRAVANAARKHWRSTSRRERREALVASSIVVEHHEFDPEVILSLARLSPQQRAVVHLAYWEDLTAPAIAARLGVGDGTVRRQLARARATLREALHGFE